MNQLSVKKDRYFHSKKDSYIGITVLLDKNKILKKIVSLLSDFAFLFFRLFSLSKRSDNSIISIISLQRIGDTVFAIPAISKIVEEFKEKKIFIITFPDTALIMELKFPKIEYVILNKDWFFYDRRIANKFSRKLVNKLSSGIIFDLTANVTSASLIITAGARIKVGSNLDYYRKAYSHFVPLRNKPHLIDLYFDIIEQLITIKDRNSLKQHKVDYNAKDKILIHPFSIRKSKEWNLRKFILLAHTLSKNYNICLISPEGFIEEDIMDEINRQGIPSVLTATMEELIEQIKKCALFIGNDTGPLYIANLLGKPTFTIYGPTNPDFSKPFGDYHRVIRKIIKCSPLVKQYCFTLGGIYCNSYECMNGLTFAEVESDIISFIEILHIDKKLPGITPRDRRNVI